MDVTFSTLCDPFNNCTASWLVNEQCFVPVSFTHNTHIIYSNDTAFPSSNWIYTPNDDTCGTSYVNYDNTISCFTLNSNGYCETDFEPDIVEFPNYMYLHIEGGHGEVNLTRVPFGARFQPLAPATGNTNLMLEIFTESLCRPFPSGIVDVSGQTWSLVDVLSSCGEGYTATFTTTRTATGTLTNTNETHDLYTVMVGGTSSTCSPYQHCLGTGGDFTYLSAKPIQSNAHITAMIMTITATVPAAGVTFLFVLMGLIATF